ncbi:MAG: FKBP-type peptidyl-prolyl cis-trans isomerase [Bacteroidota bacterium]
MLTRITLFFLVILFSFGCNKSTQLKEYTRDSNGFYYKLLTIGDGNESPEKVNVIVVDAVMKTLSDSVFWDTKHDATNGLYVELYHALIRGSCNSYFLKMVEGDSVSFLINPVILFRNYFDTIVPEFCIKDSLVRFDVKLNQIMSKAEYAAMIKNSSGEDVEEDTELEELQAIDCFLNQNHKSTQVNSQGIYVLERTHTGQQEVSVGKKIKIAYQGSFLDGRLIDKTEQTMEYIYGTPDQELKGLNIVIGSLKKGETTKIILPSRLAFGELGSSNGSVPPYTPLVYSIKIIDIK